MGRTSTTRAALRARLGRIVSSALQPPELEFDASFYAGLYPDMAGGEPEELAEHYREFGWREGRDPCARFSSRHYVAAHPDIIGRGIDPLTHYQGASRWRQNQVYLSGWGVGGTTRVHVGEIAVIQPLFEADHYAGQLDTLGPLAETMSDQDLAAHYLTVGWRCGLDPAAGFSTLGYLVRNPDVLNAGVNPLRHYASMGHNEGREGFMPSTAKAILKRIFDRDYLYAQTRPSLQIATESPMAALLERQETALIDYLRRGTDEGLDPSPDFNCATYMAAHPEAVESGFDPFVHYAMFADAGDRLRPMGYGATRPILPLAQNDEKAQEPDPQRLKRDMESVRGAFDATFYRAKNEDLTGDDETLLAHFMILGWREGRDPAPDFSVSDYLEMYSDIAGRGTNPFLHWVLFGRKEGRLGRRPPKVDTSEQKGGAGDEIGAVRGHFNASFYRLMNPDLDGDNETLLAHYMETGWREGRDPAPDFSTSYYLERYSDIADSGANPFLHWVLFGRDEGRRAQPKGAVALPQTTEASTVPPHLNAVLQRSPEGMDISPPAQVNPAQMHIHWVVPDFARGGGGHMTIFRMVRHLENFGHRCTIWIERRDFHDNTDEAYEDIVKYFQCVEADVHFVEDGFWAASGDAVFATGWSTAYLVEQARGFAAKYYFVQDHEPEFYPTGTEYYLSRETYDFDFAAICASPWLEGIMQERYGRWARGFFLAYDRNVYNLGDGKGALARHAARLAARPDPAQSRDKLRIAVYARAHTARRCVDLAFMAFEELARLRDDFEVHLFGQEELPFLTAPFAAKSHGVLDAEELAELYRDCHLAVSFSGTNYSLVPQEMMACGLPLVELDVGSTQAIFPEGVVTLAGPSPRDIAEKVSALLDDPDARRAQAEAALAWVEDFTWERSAREVEAGIRDYLTEKQPDLMAPAVQVPREILLDVVVPTYNGRQEFPPVLEALRGQAEYDRMRIICVDSSSPDGTGDWLAKEPGVLLDVIDQKDFQHGRTRNYGASLGDAPVVAFLTQDAQPANPHWATDILKMFAHFPEAAGLFGRHLPYPEHPLYVREEILTHFENLKKWPLELSRETDPEKWARGDQGWRQVLHFYSDNNSAMRRTIWNDIPYPEVDYGEDQVWARDIIEAGHTKLYAPTAMVYHSHDYDPAATYKRAFTEGAFFFEHFGYELGKGSASDVKGRIARETRNFELWARRNNVDEAEIAMRKENIAEKYRGWRDGRAAAGDAKQ